jgi:hypothetical protein
MENKGFKVGFNTIVESKLSFGGRDGVVGCYCLDSLGIESQWGRDFPFATRPTSKPTHHPAKFASGLLRGKSAGADHPPPLITSLRMSWKYTSAFLLRLHKQVMG